MFRDSCECLAVMMRQLRKYYSNIKTSTGPHPALLNTLTGSYHFSPSIRSNITKDIQPGVHNLYHLSSLLAEFTVITIQRYA